MMCGGTYKHTLGCFPLWTGGGKSLGFPCIAALAGWPGEGQAGVRVTGTSFPVFVSWG